MISGIDFQSLGKDSEIGLQDKNFTRLRRPCSKNLTKETSFGRKSTKAKALPKLPFSTANDPQLILPYHNDIKIDESISAQNKESRHSNHLASSYFSNLQVTASHVSCLPLDEVIT